MGKIGLKFRDCKGCGVNFPMWFFPLSNGKLKDRNGQFYRRHRCGENGNSCYHGHKKDLPNSKRAKQKMLREYKMSCSCKTCGYSKKTHTRFSTWALDFHHHRKNKKFNVGNMIRDGYSWKSILKEISKCVVICCRCHVEIHDSTGHKGGN